MRRVLVTGASGYIGQHLIQRLHEDGLAVVGFGRSPRPERLPAVEWQRGDVRRLADLERAVGGCAAVVHLACLPLGQSWQDPQRDFEVNAGGTFNVLHAARMAGVRRVVYASTAQVYGPAERLPLAEDDPPQPASPYAASKLCGETLCAACTRSYGLETTILRVFNVYGAPLDGSERQTVESIFVRRVARGLPPLVKGNPAEARDFIHVRDVVRAIRLALETEGVGAVINVGSGVMTPLLDLAQLAIEVAEANLTPVVEETDASPLRLQADPRRARELLGFEAEISLRAGIAGLLEAERLRAKVTSP